MTRWQTSTESKDTSATKINNWNGSSDSRWAVWLLIKAFVVLHIKSHATIPTLEARLVPYLTTQTQITRYHHHQSSLLHDNNVHQCRTTAMLQLLKILAIYHPLLVDSARHTIWHSLPQGWHVVRTGIVQQETSPLRAMPQWNKDWCTVSQSHTAAKKAGIVWEVKNKAQKHLFKSSTSTAESVLLAADQAPNQQPLNYLVWTGNRCREREQLRYPADLCWTSNGSTCHDNSCFKFTCM